MNSFNKNCFVIGQGALLIKCTEKLLGHGYRIFGIVTSDESVKNWANIHQVPIKEPFSDLYSFFKQQPFDYLFSIVNGIRLSGDILSLPDKYAINFHDSPLPKYAGVNATSWVILNQEKEHAVTWHIMTPDYDAGHIIKQQRIKLSQDETAFTLNGKCFEAALISFEILIDELARNQEKLIEQNLIQRSYYSRSIVPKEIYPIWCQGLINWDLAADRISAITRALNFGPYQNPLALPKICAKGDFYIIHSIEITKNISAFIAGTIISIEKEYITVSTQTFDIKIFDFFLLNGEKITVLEFVKRYNLKSGDCLQKFYPESSDEIRKFDKNISKHETFWVKQLSSIEQVKIPYEIRTAEVAEKSISCVLIDLDSKQLVALYELFGEIEHKDLLIYIFIIFLARLSDTETFDIAFFSNIIPAVPLFSPLIPLKIDLNLKHSCRYLINRLHNDIESTKKHLTFSSDIFLRYPELKALKEMPSICSVGIASNNRQLNNSLDILKNGMNYLFEITGENDSLELNFKFNTTKFSVNDVKYMANLYKNFVQEIIEDPEKMVSNISLLTSTEIEQIVFNWNKTEVPYISDKCFHQIFEKIAFKNPNSIALIFERDVLTYGELNIYANQLAIYLRKLGVNKEVLVGLCLKRSFKMIIGLLSIFKAGGAYLPLDPEYPKERLDFIIKDAKISLILTEESLVSCIPENSITNIICLDKEWAEITKEESGNIITDTNINNLAYVIYTSGSTGKPKGVLITHRGLNNLVKAQEILFNINQGDNVLQFSSISFDAAIWETSMALGAGASLCLGESENMLPGQNLIELLNKQKVTIISLPPSALSILPDAELPTVRIIISGSEACWMDLAQKWSKGRRFFNGYGPTEITVCSTFSEYTGNDWKLNIGRPIVNTKIYILDSNLQPVPQGVPGEIFIDSVGIARGYLNRSELTAERFLLNPFNLSHNSYMYKTGDLAKFLHDGNIEFIGRKDNQVKIRGFRIELEEIETVLLDHPDVSEAALRAIDLDHDKRLIAYLVLKTDKLLLNELRNYLSARLPGFMIPSKFIFLDSMPKMPNGKIDKNRLSALTLYDENGKDIIAPRSHWEEILTILWAKLLHLSLISIDDDFFDLGGHSLLAVQMITQLNSSYNLSIPISLIFQASTIRKFALFLTEGFDKNLIFNPLIKIQPEGNKIPIFAVHPGDGNVFCYTNLVRLLGADRPFYGFQAYGVEKGTETINSLQGMASKYIEELKKIRAEGPYILLGYCAGGTIAFEMAQQLSAQGADVNQLILIDSTAPYMYGYIDEVTNFLNFIDNLQQISNVDIFPVYCELRKIVSNKKAIYDDLQLLSLEERLTSFGTIFKNAGVLPPSVEIDYLARLFNVWLGLGDLLSYKIKSYNGEVIFFYAKDDINNQAVNDSSLGWSKFIDLNVIDVPGNHYSMLRLPNVKFLARQLNIILNKNKYLSEKQKKEELICP